MIRTCCLFLVLFQISAVFLGLAKGEDVEVSGYVSVPEPVKTGSCLKMDVREERLCEDCEVPVLDSFEVTNPRIEDGKIYYKMMVKDAKSITYMVSVTLNNGWCAKIVDEDSEWIRKGDFQPEFAVQFTPEEGAKEVNFDVELKKYAPTPEFTACTDEVARIESEPLMLGRFKPECVEGSGIFKRTQCHAGYCFCVDQRTGQEIYGTKATEQFAKVDCSTDCERSAKAAISEIPFFPSLGVPFVRKCEEDGSYSKQQCHVSTGYCWCVHPKTGEEIAGTKTGPREPKVDCNVSTLCSQKRVELQTSRDLPLVGLFIPQCQSDGNYRRKQCAGSSGECWCVDHRSGKELIGTRLGPGHEVFCDCPRVCPRIMAPVCGTNDVTYNNDCLLKTARMCDDLTIQLKHQGPCKAVLKLRGAVSVPVNSLAKDLCLKMSVQEDIQCEKEDGEKGCEVPVLASYEETDPKLFDGKIHYTMELKGAQSGAAYTISATLNNGWCSKNEDDGEWIRKGDFQPEFAVQFTPEEGQKETTVDIELKQYKSEPSDCKKKRDASQENSEFPSIGGFTHECEEDGSYSKQQCHGSTGFCWCVHPKSGEEITGTKTGPGKPKVDCNTPQSPTTSGLKVGGYIRIPVTELKNGSCLQMMLREEIYCEFPQCEIPVLARFDVTNPRVENNGNIYYEMEVKQAKPVSHMIHAIINNGWCSTGEKKAEWIRDGDYFKDYIVSFTPSAGMKTVDFKLAEYNEDQKKSSGTRKHDIGFVLGYSDFTDNNDLTLQMQTSLEIIGKLKRTSDVKVGVLAYGKDAKIVQSLTSAEEVEQMMYFIKLAKGFRPASSAMELSLKKFFKTGGRADATKTLVVFLTEMKDENAPKQVKLLREAGVKVIVVGTKGNANKELLKELGGTLVDVDSLPKQLDALIGGLLEKPSECERKRFEASQKSKNSEFSSIGGFTHECEEDGSYSKQQCHGSTGFCWCVHPKTGEELSGTKTGPGKPRIDCKVPTLCSQKRVEMEHEDGKFTIEGRYTPQCNIDGSYYKRQCYPSTGYCWCVEPNTGKEIDGTKTAPGTPQVDCERPLKKTCAQLKAESEKNADGERALGKMEYVCEQDGSFRRGQCHPSTGFCWCIDPVSGAEIPNTQRGPGQRRVRCDCVKPCTRVYSPVCGSDDQTYANMCEMENARCRESGAVVFVHEGPCERCAGDLPVTQCSYKPCAQLYCEEDREAVCKPNFCRGCNAEFYKNGTKFQCKTPKCSQVCTFEYQPFCGSNGKTYSNKCTMEIAQCLDHSIINQSPGECEEVKAVKEVDPVLAGEKAGSAPKPSKVTEETRPPKACPQCARKACDFSTCPALPSARCRVKDCSCEAEFVNKDGSVVESCVAKPALRKVSNSPVIEPPIEGCYFACPMSYQPVCGSDRKSHANQCVLDMLACTTKTNVYKMHDGECGHCQEVCTREFFPVCGSDGNTYSNECQMRYKVCKTNGQVQFAYHGRCGDPVCPPGDCADALEPVCSTDHVTYDNQCLLQKEACKTKGKTAQLHHGECQQCSPFCTREFDPYCGTDGKTYSNKCMMNYGMCKSNGRVQIKYRGNCASPECPTVCAEGGLKVCGTDGKTYSNICMLQQVSCSDPKVHLKHVGKCKKHCRRRLCRHHRYRPVCASDGKTYANRCELRKASCLSDERITFLRKGSCDDKCGTNERTVNCVADPCLTSFCPGAPRARCVPSYCGSCTAKFVLGSRDVTDKCGTSCARACTLEYFPVCANNGVSYGNTCALNVARCESKGEIAFAYKGHCKTRY